MTFLSSSIVVVVMFLLPMRKVFMPLDDSEGASKCR